MGEGGEAAMGAAEKAAMGAAMEAMEAAAGFGRVSPAELEALRQVRAEQVRAEQVRRRPGGRLMTCSKRLRRLSAVSRSRWLVGVESQTRRGLLSCMCVCILAMHWLVWRAQTSSICL